MQTRTALGRVREVSPRPVPPGLRPLTPVTPSVLLPPAEPSPLHEAILAWLDRQS